jgi:RNA polymerase sigma-70 factor, ECF subfamily
MPTDPDQDILDLLDAGDRNGALRLLMDRYGKAVYRFIRFQLRNSPSADDVHAKVFIQAHRDLPRFARRSPLRAWLYAIARNRVRDSRKGEKPPAEQVGAEIPDDKEPVDEKLDDARLAKALHDCILLLPDKAREAMILRREGLTFEEIAETLGERANAVQARVSRALPTLRECIERRTGARV